MNLGQKAAKSQVERFQHMDVGAQVVPQGAGHCTGAAGDAADRSGRRVGDEERVHVGKHQQPITQLCLLRMRRAVFISAYSCAALPQGFYLTMQMRRERSRLKSPSLLDVQSSAKKAAAQADPNPWKSFLMRHRYLPEDTRRPQQAAAPPASLIPASRCQGLLSTRFTQSGEKRPPSLPLTGIHVVLRDGVNTQDDRARPPRVLRGSCCKALNPAPTTPLAPPTSPPPVLHPTRSVTGPTWML